MGLLTQLEYDRLLAEILDVNMFYRRQFATSPTITELSKMTGASEENILESMEFGHPSFQYVS
jgi:hypothetical protein